MSVYITREMIRQAARENGRRNDSRILDRFIGTLARKWKSRKAISELRAMSDRQLRDMGIYRSDIPRVVNGHGDRELGLTGSETVAARDRRRAEDPQQDDLAAVSA